MMWRLPQKHMYLRIVQLLKHIKGKHWIRYGLDHTAGRTGNSAAMVNKNGLRAKKTTGGNGHKRNLSNADTPLNGRRGRATNGFQRQEMVENAGIRDGTNGGDERNGTKMDGDGGGLTARSFIFVWMPCSQVAYLFNGISVDTRNSVGRDW